ERFARHAAIIGVRKNGADHLFGIVMRAKDVGAFRGMLAIGSMAAVGPAFVVEIMEQRDDAPEFLIGVVLLGVSADAGFHGQHVLAKAFGLRVFAQEIPGVFTRRHEGKTSDRRDSIPKKGREVPN